MKEVHEIAISPQASEGQQSTPLEFGFNRIVVATDFTPGSEKAVDYAVQLAQRLGASLTVLHVHFERPEWWESAIDGIEVSDWEQWREAMEKKLADEVERAKRSYRAVDSLLRTASDFRLETVTVAKELRADLLVVSTHGYVGWKHFLFGSHAEEILERAPCPILVVHRGVDEEVSE
jgi:nucleotide-binding universal stress UspA family protein